MPSLSVESTEAQLEAVRILLGELCSYNEHTNLVSCADPLVVVREHILDSLSLIVALREKPARADQPGALRLIDIGSGAGFPAMILAIFLPDCQVCLVESIAKKTRFLTQLVDSLHLSDRVRVINQRAEELAHDRAMRAAFDLATARAVGKLDMVAELALPFLRQGGWLLAQKSKGQLEEEKARASRALPLLGGELKSIELPDPQALGKERAILIIEKMKETPELYPRSSAKIKRSPLAG